MKPSLRSKLELQFLYQLIHNPFRLSDPSSMGFLRVRKNIELENSLRKLFREEKIQLFEKRFLEGEFDPKLIQDIYENENRIPFVFLKKKLQIQNQRESLGKILTSSQKDLQLSESPMAIREAMIKKLLAQESKALSLKFQTLSQLLSHYVFLKESRVKDAAGLLSEWPSFSQLVPIQNGNLVILASRPSVGKSSFALSLLNALEIPEGEKIVFFSLEMSAQENLERILAATQKVSLYHIKNFNVGFSFFESLALKSNIFIDDSPGLSLRLLEYKLEFLAQKYPISFIIIDYLQLMESDTKSTSGRQFEISEISRGLKLLAKKFQIAILALSQLSRSVESRDQKVPRLSDLRDSGSIEQDADIVLLLHREDYYKPDADPVTYLKVAKNRNGALGDIKFNFLKKYTLFEEAENG